MLDDRAPGQSIRPDQVLWVDFESKGLVPIAAGADQYARNAHAIIMAWAIGDGPVHIEAVPDFEHGPLRWYDLNWNFQKFFASVERGEAVLCAHNASFDRAVWAHATNGFPLTNPSMWIDSRVQAAASGLPAQLEWAAKYTGTDILKDKAGKKLIKLFTLPSSDATPQSHPEEWKQFIAYARQDVAAMRSLFHRTRQLSPAEWHEYWAAEQINERGVGIDLDLVEAAAHMAVEDGRRSAIELAQLTSNAVTTVNQVKRIDQWLMALLPSDGREILVKTEKETDEDGTVTQEEERSLERKRLERLIAYLEDVKTPLVPPLAAALRVLHIRYYGGSKTPAKFAKMLMQHTDGVIRGQYVFNGASQTGRFSSKGVQIHNLMRDAAPYEMDAIDALTGGATYDEFAALGDTTPVSRKLSLLIRPALVPQPGRVFVWGDWANIEARVLPWLADDREADERLDIFRAVDADPKIPDIYTRTAAGISRIDIALVDKKIRQRGKVVELACGFGGGKNALLSMAASYHMHLDDDEAQEAVDTWREANPWAQTFWWALMDAADQAVRHPEQVFDVGRVAYVFLPGYLGGSLLCKLPSGRFLTYRRCKWERVDRVDEKTGAIIESKRELMFSRDMGRMKIWPGLLCENNVQAVAADILRGTLLRLEDGTVNMPVRLHTHDEVLVETPEFAADNAAFCLKAVMEQGFDWSEGLPIAADTVTGRWYSKNENSWGL